MIRIKGQLVLTGFRFTVVTIAGRGPLKYVELHSRETGKTFRLRVGDNLDPTFTVDVTR